MRHLVRGVRRPGRSACDDAPAPRARRRGARRRARRSVVASCSSDGESAPEAPSTARLRSPRWSTGRRVRCRREIDENGEVEPPVVYVTDGERRHARCRPAGVGRREARPKRRHVRFADDRSEAVDDTSEVMPVHDDGVMLVIGDMPEPARDPHDRRGVVPIDRRIEQPRRHDHAERVRRDRHGVVVGLTQRPAMSTAVIASASATISSGSVARRRIVVERRPVARRSGPRRHAGDEVDRRRRVDDRQPQRADLQRPAGEHEALRREPVRVEQGHLLEASVAAGPQEQQQTRHVDEREHRHAHLHRQGDRRGQDATEHPGQLELGLVARARPARGARRGRHAGRARRRRCVRGWWRSRPARRSP